MSALLFLVSNCQNEKLLEKIFDNCVLGEWVGGGNAQAGCPLATFPLSPNAVRERGCLIGGMHWATDNASMWMWKQEEVCAVFQIFYRNTSSDFQIFYECPNPCFTATYDLWLFMAGQFWEMHSLKYQNGMFGRFVEVFFFSAARRRRPEKYKGSTLHRTWSFDPQAAFNMETIKAPLILFRSNCWMNNQYMWHTIDYLTSTFLISPQW